MVRAARRKAGQEAQAKESTAKAAEAHGENHTGMEPSRRARQSARSSSTVKGVNWLDLILAVAVIAGAIHGLKLGALVQLSSFAGFWLGFAIGAVLALPIAGAMHPGVARFAITIMLVLGLAGLGGTLGRFIGIWSNPTMRKFHLGSLDSFVGSAIAAVAVLLSAWLVGSLLAQSSSVVLASALERSSVIRSLDAIMPPMPAVVNRVQSFLAAEGLQPVFVNLPPLAATPVALPADSVASALARRASPAVVKVMGSACGLGIEGSGFLAAPNLIVTNAHVVAGTKTSIVQGKTWVESAKLVYFNPQLDIAVLKIAQAKGPVLALAKSSVLRGERGVILGYPNNRGLTVSPAAVAAVFPAAGRDIYGQSLVTRQVEEIDGLVQAGNSGGPLVGRSGVVIGLVFSRSASSNSLGYALTMGAVSRALEQAKHTRASVASGACTPA